MPKRSEVFDERRPKVTDADLVKAAGERRIVASFDARPAIGPDSRIVSVGIKFALGNETFETVLIDRYAAKVLQLLLDELEQADWRATQSAPPGQKLN